MVARGDLTNSYNASSGRADQAKTAPSQSLLSHITKVNTTPATAAHGLDATKQLDRGQITDARKAMTSAIQANKNTLAAVERDVDVAKREIDQASVASGHGVGALERTTIAPDTGVELVAAALTGAPLAGKGSLTTAVKKGMDAMDTAGQVNTVIEDRKVSSDEIRAEIADILTRSSTPAPEEGQFGLIVQANTGPRVDVTNDWKALVDDHGEDAVADIYNLDPDNPTSAFPELQALHAANTEMENGLAELNAYDEGLDTGLYTAAGVEVAGELPGAQVDADDTVNGTVPLASLDSAQRDAIIASGVKRSVTSADQDLEAELQRQANRALDATSTMGA